ncbi:hypothetical protein GGR51DRAFT_518755 [Nemania sp. FL0031]|nr:hypothetical protein GGR51DRAFT_518755 [Nemania sp. FL0031]
MHKYSLVSRQLGSGISEDLLQSNATQSTLIPFLPAVITQGHKWSFAAAMKSGRHTLVSDKVDHGL